MSILNNYLFICYHVLSLRYTVRIILPRTEIMRVRRKTIFAEVVEDYSVAEATAVNRNSFRSVYIVAQLKNYPLGYE